MPDSTCRLCGVASGRVLFTGTDHREGLGGSFGVLRCDGCGLVRTDPLPDDLAAWYPASYQQHVSGEGLTTRVVRASTRWAARPGRPSAAVGVVERLVPDADMGGPPTGLRVLDVGAGNGTIVRALTAAGVDAHGVEPSMQAVEAAHRAGAATVHRGLLEDDPPPVEGPFDLIRFYQVLEHVPDPIATLRHAAALLAPGGRLVVGVPNFGGAGARLFRASWDGLELPRHIHHFTRRTLRLALSASGLRPVRMRTVAVFGVLPASLDARAHRGESQSGWGHSLPLRALLYPVEVALGLAGLGDGIMAVAEAPPAR